MSRRFSQFIIVSFDYIRGCIQKFPDWVVTKYTLRTINTHWEVTQRVMTTKLTRLTHKIAIQLHLVAKSCIIHSSRSRRSVRNLLDTPSYNISTYLSLCNSRSWEANSDSAKQEIPRLPWNPEFHYRFHKCTPLVPFSPHHILFLRDKF
jgi:hypothetical protein